MKCLGHTHTKFTLIIKCMYGRPTTIDIRQYTCTTVYCNLFTTSNSNKQFEGAIIQAISCRLLDQSCSWRIFGRITSPFLCSPLQIYNCNLTISTFWCYYANVNDNAMCTYMIKLLTFLSPYRCEISVTCMFLCDYFFPDTYVYQLYIFWLH